MELLLQRPMHSSPLCMPSTSGRTSYRGHRCLCTAAQDDAEKPQPQPLPKRSKLPDRGFFAEADTKAEVYSPLGGVDRGSIYKRGGRFSPEFLWNTNWQDQLALEEDVERARLEAEGQDPQPASGRLSFRRVADLNSLDVDLSQQLQPRRAEASSANAAAAAGADSAPWQGRKAVMDAAAAAALRRPAEGAYPRMPPRRVEAKRWERTTKSFTRRSAQKPASPEEKAALIGTIRAERAAYARYKQQLLVSTAALGAVLTAVVFALYAKDVGASFGVGAVGSVAYLHLLNRSIDAVGLDAGDLPPEVGSAAELSAGVQPPRLLIPFIMAMAYNRWNTLAADNVGVTLQLMPMLLGFLTYKGAVIARGALDLFADLSGSNDSQAAQAAAEAAGEAAPLGSSPGRSDEQRQGKADDLMVGRDYASRVLQG